MKKTEILKTEILNLGNDFSVSACQHFSVLGFD